MNIPAENQIKNIYKDCFSDSEAETAVNENA